MKRRAALASIVVAFVLAGCQWPMFGYGPAHTGHNTTESAVGVDNVASLTEQWRFTGETGDVNDLMYSAPAVARGIVHVGSGDGNLYALDAGGSGCSGAPVTCTASWTSPAGFPVSPPAIVGGVAYAASGDGYLHAFDAEGEDGCGGTPQMCEPRWSASVGFTESAPTVADGRVYIGGYDGPFRAFDAAGVENCSGTPTVCEPLWSADTTGYSSAAVHDGVVYVGSFEHGLLAFDAAGVANCSGQPVACEPLWTGAVGGAAGWGSPSVQDGLVYLASNEGTLHAFDADGVTDCSGDPVVCEPLWTGPVGDDSQNASVPSVADGRVYLVTEEGLGVFDAEGAEGCAGQPVVCEPLWTAGTFGIGFGPVAVANGVAYAGNVGGKLAAFDASGVQGCSGTPKVCAPLWETAVPGGSGSPPTVANGRVYIGSRNNTLVAYGLP